MYIPPRQHTLILEKSHDILRIRYAIGKPKTSGRAGVIGMNDTLAI